MSTLQNPSNNFYDQKPRHADQLDTFAFLSERISKLSADVGNLVSLRIDLLKAELQDGAATLARDSALIVAGAVFGLFAFGVLTFAIIGFIASALTMGAVMNWAVSAIIVFVAYSIIAGGLIFAGIQHLKKRGVAPEKSIAEVKRDKEWVREIRK